MKLLQDLLFKFKKNKARYYLMHYWQYLWHFRPKKSHFETYYASLPAPEQKYVDNRVAYYLKLSDKFSHSPKAESIAHFTKTHKKNPYFFDLFSHLRYFPKDFLFDYVFGDVTQVPDYPSFVKSRPIAGDNKNAILLKLNKIRHFFFIKDPLKFSDKIDKMVWRGKANGKPHRQGFLAQLTQHSRCDIGQTDIPREGKGFLKDKMSIPEQLQYKYIFVIEGNDVATNLKWAMSSHSLVLATSFNYETWFMEGKLKAGIHYVALKPDYSDLEEKMDYYSQHRKAAEKITQNARDYVSQFQHPKREKLIAYLVLKKYFGLQK